MQYELANQNILSYQTDLFILPLTLGVIRAEYYGITALPGTG